MTKIHNIIKLTFFVILCSVSFAGSIDTLSSWTSTIAYAMGEDELGGDTYGQTFDIPGSNARLNKISFMVRDYGLSADMPEACTFEVFVMAWSWSNLRPTGPILFRSQPLVTNGSGANQLFEIDAIDTLLLADQQYVVFFTSNNFLNQIPGAAGMCCVGNIYSGGILVAQFDGHSFNDVLSDNWSIGLSNMIDLAIRLDYTEVPEPASAMLLLLGAAWMRTRRRR